MSSKYVPIVGHMHMPTKPDAMRKPLCSMEMLLDKKVLSSQHPVRRGNASTRRADVPRQLDAHEKLCHVAVRRQGHNCKRRMSMHVEIAQHHVVHVKLRRARRHAGHEVRPEEGRRRGAKQRQRRRGEAGRPGRKRMEKLLDVARTDGFL